VPELRVDPLTGLKSIIAGDRAGRPGGGFDVRPAEPIDFAADPFAPGHEDRTPPELYAVRPDGGAPNGPGWTTRVVPNLYPALAPDAPAPERHADPDLFTAQPAHGGHEVIVNAPDPVTSLGDLAPAQVAGAMETWRARLRAHAGAACRHLIVNERREAGASLPHTHAQLYALDFVPAAIARERERCAAYAVRTMGGDLLGDLVQEEVRQRVRIVAIDEEAVAMAPYASRVPFQLLLAPRRSRARFEDDGPTGAALLHDVLGRLRRRLGAAPPLNLWVRTAPRGADHFCWRIDVLPRLTHLAGLELGAGVNLCVVPPEQAAEELRTA
jgi:UDPglucose--hexose-1-phosphate uridylyltransferase